MTKSPLRAKVKGKKFKMTHDLHMTASVFWVVCQCFNFKKREHIKERRKISVIKQSCYCGVYIKKYYFNAYYYFNDTWNNILIQYLLFLIVYIISRHF
jgi:hypothetical protein